MLAQAKAQLSDPASASYRVQIAEYWREHLGREVTPLWHLAFTNATGREEVRYIPGYIWNQKILPYLNDFSVWQAFTDKGLSDVFLHTANRPRTLLSRMHGHYYRGQDLLARRDVWPFLSGFEGEAFIIKGSRTDGGAGVRLLEIVNRTVMVGGKECQIADLEAMYGTDFLVQERILQHEDMARLHPASVNTIRVITLRWRDTIVVPMSIARFGIGDSLNDNLATGGLACGIDADGRLMDRAYDIRGNVYSEHPTSGYRFSGRMTVPSHDRVCAFARDLHRQMFHFDIVSWDIAVGQDGEPVFVEVNFHGGCDSYQLVCGRSLFGDLTEEILHAVRDGR
ncbi:MAG: hypothetical protein NTV73_01130 [Hyphomicrobiales bacterium]|nr:hypothetical protein [Hyphomicrobiales bacterium]